MRFSGRGTRRCPPERTAWPLALDQNSLSVHHRRLPMAQAITHRFSIDQSQQALEAVARMETVKAVITPMA